MRINKAIAFVLAEAIFSGMAPAASAQTATAAPVNAAVPAAAVTYSSIALLWDKPEEYGEITGYRVYIDGNLAAETAANETYYPAEGLEPDTEYSFAVTAVSSGAESESAALSARTAVKGTVHNVMDEPYHAAGDMRR